MRGCIALALLILCSACSKDDSDLIDEFVDSVTGEVSDTRIEHVFRTYIDLAREPLDVRVLGENHLYQADEQSALAARAKSRLSRLNGTSLRALRRHIELKPPEALVDLQLLSDQGMGAVRYELVKREGRWLLSVVRFGPLAGPLSGLRRVPVRGWRQCPARARRRLLPA
jgi:hypothetical protein